MAKKAEAKKVEVAPQKEEVVVTKKVAAPVKPTKSEWEIK